jgi:hypothetical protein
MKDRIMGTGWSALREFRRSLRTISTIAEVQFLEKIERAREPERRPALHEFPIVAQEPRARLQF